MVRFTPDTLRDALWRPIAMAAPNAGVYLEVMAPDVRFACLALLTLVVAVLVVLLRKKLLSRPAVLLLVFTWLSFIPWLVTTGNGRYFIPVLLLAGPLCVALIHALPTSAGRRLALVGFVVALQGVALVESDPRNSWGLVPWDDHYLDIELTAQDRNEPAAYVLISSISYSLAAPLFDHRSRWIGLSSLPADPLHSPDGERAQALLARSRAEGFPIKLFVPSVPGRVTPQGQPDGALRDEINRLLAPHRLALEPGAQCGLRRSPSMAGRMRNKTDAHSLAVLNQVGFWVCPLAYPVQPPPRSVPAPAIDAQALARADRAFAVLEQRCPRFFPPRETSSIRVDGAFERRYSSDIKAYVLDDGQVMFRYWRALTANRLGTVDQVLAPQFTMDCNNINGRSGLPWERTL